jgi:hypothetical protein
VSLITRYKDGSSLAAGNERVTLERHECEQKEEMREGELRKKKKEADASVKGLLNVFTKYFFP